ncbi:MAG: hypothetical protein WC325_10965, partial [Candidatus Bathyarchaeia archaeon]
MNEFPERNLTDQYISQSFENLLQYVTASGLNNLTDGLGNQINILNITASYSTTCGGTIANAVTASYAHSASNALSASYAPVSGIDTSSFIQNSQTASMTVLSSSYATSAAYAPGSSTLDTSSFVLNSYTASMTVLSSSYSVTAAFSLNSTTIDTSSFVTNDMTSSFLTGNTSSFITNDVTASMTVASASTAISASWAPPGDTSYFLQTSLTASMLEPYLLSENTSSFVQTSQTASMNVLSSSYALSAAYAPGSSTLDTSSFVLNSYTASMTVASASQAISASWAPPGDTSMFVQTSLTASMLEPYLLSADTSSFVTNAQTSSFLTGDTSSFILDNQTASMTVLSASYAPMPDVSNFVTFAQTASFLTGDTSSFVLNSMTSSFLTGNTSSFATTASNTFVGNQTISGSVYMTGSVKVNDKQGGSTNQGDVLTYSRTATSVAGMTATCSFVDNADGTVTILSGSVRFYNNSDFQHFIQRYEMPHSTTLTPTNNAVSYVVADYNSGSPIYRIETSQENLNHSDIHPIYTIYRENNLICYLYWVSTGRGLSNKLNQRLIRTERFARESGLTLSTSGSFVKHTEGKVWIGSNRTTQLAFDSFTSPMRRFYHSASAWTYVTASSFDTWSYDTGTETASLGNNRFGVRWVYRDIDTENPTEPSVNVVLGTSNASSLATAQTELAPSSLPARITGMGMLIGRFIVQQNVTSSVLVESAFTQQFTPSLATVHSNLANLDFASSGHTGFVPTSGTSSFVTNDMTSSFLTGATSSFVLNNQTASMTVASASQAISASWAPPGDTSMFVQTSLTASMLEPYLLSSNTSSFVTNEMTSSFLTGDTSSFVTNDMTSSFLTGDTSSFVTNEQTASMLESYLLIANTSSFVVNSQTSSFLTGDTSSFVQNSQTASMTVLSASYAENAGVAIDTSSFVTNEMTASFLTGDTSSFVTNDMTASMTVLSSSYAISAAYAPGSSTLDTSSFIKNEQTNAFDLNSSLKLNAGPLIIVTPTASLDSLSAEPTAEDYSHDYSYAVIPVFGGEIQGILYEGGCQNSASLDANNYVELTWTDLNYSSIIKYNIYRQSVDSEVTEYCGLIGSVLPGVENFTDSGSAVIGPLDLNDAAGKLIFDDHISSSYVMYKDSDDKFHILEENTENDFGFMTLGSGEALLSLNDSDGGGAGVSIYKQAIGISALDSEYTGMVTWVETGSCGVYSTLADPVLLIFARGLVGINYVSYEDDGYHMFSVNGPSVFTGSINVTEAVTASFFLGTSSWAESSSVAISASYAPCAGLDTSSLVTIEMTASMTVLSSSYATSAAYAPGSATIDTSSFATTSSNLFYGTQTISGSLNVSGTDSDINVENNININNSPADDLKTSGVTFQLITGVDVAFGDVGYISSSGVVELANADAIEHCGAVVMCAD